MNLPQKRELSSDNITSELIRDRKIQIGRQLLNIAADIGATYIVVGLDGMEALKRGKEILGSVSDFIVSKARCTTVVAR